MTGLAPVRAGDVIQVAERDYCYGVGSLTLRVTDVHGLVYLGNEPWVIIDGVAPWSNRREGAERYAQVRVAGIRYLPNRGGPRQ